MAIGNIVGPKTTPVAKFPRTMSKRDDDHATSIRNPKPG